MGGRGSHDRQGDWTQTGEQRASCFVIQKISIELQRGNASSVLGPFPFSRGLDEMFSILKNV